MPRQARKPCSGCGRCSRMSSQSAAVAGPIRRASAPDALDRPAGVSPMAGRHVFRHRRVFVIAAHAHVRGDPLALEEDFDRPRGQPRVDFGAGEAMGNAVIMGGDLDVIIDANAACPPLGELVGLGSEGISAPGGRPVRSNCRRSRRAAGSGALRSDASISSPIAALTSARRVKSSMAQLRAEKPSLNDEHRLLDFGFGESRQMQMVWKRRHTQRSVSRTLFIPTTVASLN